jgi:hypothetical protein
MFRPLPSATLTLKPHSCTSLGVLRTSAISIVQLQSMALSVPTADHERAAIVFILLEVPFRHNAVAIQALQGVSCKGLIEYMTRSKPGHLNAIYNEQT